MARIIYAEDDELIGAVVSAALINAGHAVGWLRDGDEALRVMVRRPPNLVILDQKMPNMTGGSVLREMRVNPQLALIPVLMLTSVSGSGDQKIAYYDGVDDYMTKPFDPEELVLRVEELLEKHATRTVSVPTAI